MDEKLIKEARERHERLSREQAEYDLLTKQRAEVLASLREEFKIPEDEDVESWLAKKESFLENQLKSLLKELEDNLNESND